MMPCPQHTLVNCTGEAQRHLSKFQLRLPWQVMSLGQQVVFEYQGKFLQYVVKNLMVVDRKARFVVSNCSDSHHCAPHCDRPTIPQSVAQPLRSDRYS